MRPTVCLKEIYFNLENVNTLSFLSDGAMILRLE